MIDSSILVVEDEAIIAANLIWTLNSHGYNAIGPVATGRDAIRAVEELHPDLVLMDIELVGDMNGIVAAEKIRSIAHIPIIYLTAYTDDERLSQALKTDPYGYLVKPVQSRELYAMIEMAMSKSRTDQQIKESEQRYRAVVTRAQESILIIDPTSKKILEANPAFIEQFGYREDEISSLTMYDIVVDKPWAVDRDVELIMNKGQHVLGEKRYRCRDNPDLLVEVSAGIIERYRKDLLVFIIFQDITDKKLAEEALIEANKKIRILTGLTRHDILNQVSAIQSFHYLTMNETDPVQIQEYLSLAVKVCNKIEKTIGFTREYENFGMVSFGWQRLYQILESAKSELSLGNISIETLIPSEIEIYADPLIRKVFTTLIENAIRHGGDVKKIKISCIEQDDALIITCKDDGVGIPEEEKECIFDNGYGKHTGIGLYLISEILSLTGLSIKETGDPGKGARFEILVPTGKFRRAE